MFGSSSLFVSPFLFFFFSSASSVPSANRVSGVATSALGGGGSDGVFFTEFFSVVTGPEIHWLLSDLLTFSDNDDIFIYLFIYLFIYFYRFAFGLMTPVF